MSSSPLPPDDPTQTHFGYETVPTHEKKARVAQVFHSVASKYDLMNDVMSFGIHRLWKRIAIDTLRVRPGHRILDVAGGTGDLTRELAKRVGPQGEVILTDINSSMLEAGRKRLTNLGLVGNIKYAIANAERLPFMEHQFDRVTIAFGLRNVTHKDCALQSLYRVTKPGGKVVILEFSKPILPGLKPIYDAYSFKFLPLMGKLIANDADSYRYLAESIRMHPSQEKLLEMLQSAGFERCGYKNLSGGIVAIHWGYKL